MELVTTSQGAMNANALVDTRVTTAETVRELANDEIILSIKFVCSIFCYAENFC